MRATHLPIYNEPYDRRTLPRAHVSLVPKAHSTPLFSLALHQKVYTKLAYDSLVLSENEARFRLHLEHPLFRFTETRLFSCPFKQARLIPKSFMTHTLKSQLNRSGVCSTHAYFTYHNAYIVRLLPSYGAFLDFDLRMSTRPN